MHTNIHTNFNETNERSSVYLNFYQEIFKSFIESIRSSDCRHCSCDGLCSMMGCSMEGMGMDIQ